MPRHNGDGTVSPWPDKPGEIVWADKEVRVQQVIITNNARRGDGKETPIRAIRQVWSMDGELIAEYDPCRDGIVVREEDLRKSVNT